jgi:hypothetical protein
MEDLTPKSKCFKMSKTIWLDMSFKIGMLSETKAGDIFIFVAMLTERCYFLELIIHEK